MKFQFSAQTDLATEQKLPTGQNPTALLFNT